MVRIRVNLVTDGKLWQVPLPSYAMVPGSFKPVTGNAIAADGILPPAAAGVILGLNPSVEVDIPDSDWPGGAPSDTAWKAHIEGRYRERAGLYVPQQR